MKNYKGTVSNRATRLECDGVDEGDAFALDPAMGLPLAATAGSSPKVLDLSVFGDRLAWLDNAIVAGKCPTCAGQLRIGEFALLHVPTIGKRAEGVVFLPLQETYVLGGQKRPKDVTVPGNMRIELGIQGERPGP